MSRQRSNITFRLQSGQYGVFADWLATNVTVAKNSIEMKNFITGQFSIGCITLEIRLQSQVKQGIHRGLVSITKSMIIVQIKSGALLQGIELLTFAILQKFSA